MKLVEVVFWSLLACLLLSLNGCGSISPATVVEAAAGAGGRPEELGGAGGMNGGASGINGGPAGINGAAGAVNAGAAGAGGAGGHGGAGYPVGYGPCPPTAALSGCPIGTVEAGDGGSCPAGDRLVAVFQICVPGDGGL